MTVFSVAITLASSRKMCAPREPARAQLVAAADVDLGAELGERVDVRVEPAPADHVAAGRRHTARPKRASSGPASRNDARIRLRELARPARAS